MQPHTPGHARVTGWCAAAHACEYTQGVGGQDTLTHACARPAGCRHCSCSCTRVCVTAGEVGVVMADRSPRGDVRG